MRQPKHVDTFLYGFFAGFFIACIVLGFLFLTTGCQPKDETVYDKESGCLVQFRDKRTGELVMTQCKYGVASTKVPTPLYPAGPGYPEGPKVTWCVCKPWRFSSDPAASHALSSTSPGSSHRAR